MDTTKCEILYSEIGNKLNEIIPAKWDKILLYVEVEPGVVSYYYCFYEANNGNLVQFDDLVKKYGVDAGELRLKELELTKVIKQLNNEFANNNQERWTTMTFILNSDGEFNIDYGYEDLYETDEVTRRKQWEDKYLKI